MRKPVIGAINGAAVTGGLEFALYCDILIASENARFADTHARVGLLPTWGLSVRLPQKVGVGLARRMSLTGDYLSADDALRAGPGHRGGRARRPAADGARVAASIVGNNQGGAGAAGVLPPHRRAADRRGLWIEAESATQWMRVPAATTSPPTATRCWSGRHRCAGGCR